MVPLYDLTTSDADRFWAKVARGKPSECWPWKAHAKRKGYGRFWVGLRRAAAHRVAYALTFGDPGPDFEIDHLCRTLDCCNPKHLEAVRPDENRRRRIEFYRGAKC